MNSRYIVGLVVLTLCSAPARGELRMCSVFGDHMVLQRDQPIRIWGWTEPGQRVTVTLSGQNQDGVADDSGRFDLRLEALEAGGPYELKVEADESVTFRDVLIGEVWLCSGQSNMQWSVAQADDPDLESLTANFPNLRLITLPHVGTQEPQDDFDGSWVSTTPESVKQFSAVGYYFGRILHQSLNVPVGLIDNAWGGSACEAWVRRDLLEDNQAYQPLLERWAQIEVAEHEAIAQFEKDLAAWKQTKQGERPKKPRQRLNGQHRPANLYNGMICPILGYTLKGVIWYQGESNAGRAYQYRELFPLMIDSWREDWGQGDFSFYWVQLADFKSESTEPQSSEWAELREAQTMALTKSPRTGQAVIVDLGEAQDIHPRNKQDVGKRLARWALAQDYGISIAYRSPTFRDMTVSGAKVQLDFDHVGEGLRTFDVQELRGFTLAGQDQVFVNARARFVDEDTIEVWAEAVQDPVAVRYAWADNPVCNVRGKNGLPLTPFRTDNWPGVTADKR